MTLFFPLVKADEEKRLIYARATAEEVDKSREILDYVTAVPQFQKWSEQYSSATLGKSKGNLRAMHSPRHLAGKIEEIMYDDDGKCIDVVAKILDPTDWDKVKEGGYTGLSIGGGYLKKWQDPDMPGVTRYTPRIAEISLVDSPCLKSAVIMELRKQDGSTTEVMLKGVPRSFKDMLPPPTFGQALAKVSFSSFGRVGRVAQGVVEHPFTQKAVSYGQKASSIIGGAGKVMGTVRTARELALLGTAGAGAVGLYETRRSHKKKGTVAGKASTSMATQPLGKASPLSSSEAREKIRQTLHEYKHGKLRSYRADRPKKRMPKVTDRKQAIAIALSQARRMMDKQEPMKKIVAPLLLGALGARYGAKVGGRIGAKHGYRYFLHGGPPHAIAQHTLLGASAGLASGTATGIAAGKLIEGKKKKPRIGKSDHLALLEGMDELHKAQSA